MRCRCLSASCAQLKSFLGQGFGYRRALYSLTELCKPNSIWFSCGSRVSTMAKVSTESRTECNGVLPLPLPQLAWCASLAGAMTLRTCSGNLEDRFAPGLRGVLGSEIPSSSYSASSSHPRFQNLWLSRSNDLVHKGQRPECSTREAARRGGDCKERQGWESPNPRGPEPENRPRTARAGVAMMRRAAFAGAAAPGAGALSLSSSALRLPCTIAPLLAIFLYTCIVQCHIGS